jgi:hypothetical protein
LYNPWWNNGAAVLSSISIQGSSDFAIVPYQTTCATVLAPGRTCVIAVQFNPQASGARLGKVVVQDNSFNSPQEVILNGTGR